MVDMFLFLAFFVCLVGFQNSMLISIVTGLVSTPARSG